MVSTHAPDESSDARTDVVVASDGVDILAVGSASDAAPGASGAAAMLDGIAFDSDVSARAPEWMARPPSSAKGYDYRLQGLDLGDQLVADAQRPAPVKRAANRRARNRLLVQWTLVVAVIAVVVILLRSFVAEPMTVNSNAMVPTLPSGTSVLVVKWHALAGSTGRGDILVFKEPAGSHCSSAGSDAQRLLARVIALPGQTIWSQRGRIYIDGKKLNERGWYNPPFGEVGRNAIPRTTVPAGDYYLLGDNRTDQCDSRAFGPVARSLVVGNVVATVLRNGHPYVHSI